MAANLLSLVDRIRTALEKSGSLEATGLATILGNGESDAQMDQALRFLAGRDEILIDGVDRTVHLRRRVSQKVLEALSEADSLPIDAVARKVGFSGAICCDVIGWLEREGRITVTRDDHVSLR